MQTNFDQALRYVLIDEGGNDDDPNDHGGRTSRGITQREYNSWCQLNDKTAGDVWSCSQEDIWSIYRSQYWNPYCDQLPNGLDYLFFDISVNCGRTQAVRQFQRALNVNVDGMMGQVTMSAIQTGNTSDLIHKISEVRRNFYKSLAQFPRYGRGWLSRVDHAETGALAIYNSDSTYQKPAAETHPDATGQPTASTTVPPEASGATTVAAGGILETLNNFKDSISNFTDFDYIKYALIGIAVLSLGYSLYGFYTRSKVQAVQ